MTNSYVIWFLNNQYTYAWGENEDDALARYLQNWKNGIKAVLPATDYVDALPPHNYLPCQRNAVWDEFEPIAHQPLYPAEAPSYTERVTANALSAQVDDLKAKLAISEALVARLTNEGK